MDGGEEQAEQRRQKERQQARRQQTGFKTRCAHRGATPLLMTPRYDPRAPLAFLFPSLSPPLAARRRPSSPPVS